MNTAYILAMVIITLTGSSRPVSLVVEYSSKAACEHAKELNRQTLQDARILLSTCTPK